MEPLTLAIGLGLLVAAAGGGKPSSSTSTPGAPMPSTSTTTDPATFRARVNAIQAAAKAEGIDLRLSELARDPRKQAEYFARSRTEEELLTEAEDLDRRGLTWCAQLLRDVEPRPDLTRNTSAAPGEGWHAYELAADLTWYRNGAPSWDLYLDGDRNGYAVLGRLAKAQGLTWGAPFDDYVHVQGPPLTTNPGALFGSWAASDAWLRSRWNASGSVA